MAELLYRLGFSSSKKPWAALTAWLLALALSVGAFLMFSGSLTSTITIPDTPTSQVTDRLQDEFPEAANGTGQVVFRTADGSELTEEQREEITRLMDSVENEDAVDSVQDPFATQEQIADQRQQLEDGRAQLADGLQQIEDGRAQIEQAQEQLDASAAQLDQGQAQLDAGQEQLDAARQQAEAAGAPAAQLAPLDAQQAQLDAQQEQLDQGRAQLEEGQAQLDEQQGQLESGVEQAASAEASLDRGEAMLTYVTDYRTVSEDGSAAIGTVVFTQPTLDVAQEDKEQVISLLEGTRMAGLEVLPTTSLSQTIPSIVGPAEVVGLIVAAIVLVIMLGTFIAAGLPIITALIGVGIGATGALAFSGVVEMISVTPVLGIMLGLAVGIDYALFIINRHRTQLKEGMPLHESIGLAVGTSGNAVVFAGLTVIIALAALNVTGIPFLGLMGTVGAACVLIAVLIAITLTPALLGMIGHRALSRKERRRLQEQDPTAARRLESRSAHEQEQIEDTPVGQDDDAAAVGTGAGAGSSSAAPVATQDEASLVETGLRHQDETGREHGGTSALTGSAVGAVPVAASESADADAGRTRRERAEAERSQAERSAPNRAETDASGTRPISTGRAVLSALIAIALLAVIAIPFFSMRLGLPDGGSEPEDTAAYQSYTTVAEEFGDGYNAPLVVTVDLPEGLEDGEVMDQQLAVAEQLKGMEDVAVVVPAAVNEDSTLAMFQVIPREGPNAVSTEALVNDLRETDPAGETSNLAVAGMTSGFIDVSDKLSDALPLYLGVVVGLSLIIMILVFRSLLVPLIATGGFILSVFAAMGGVVAIYQWGWLSELFGVTNPGPVLSFLPTIMIGVLFGLAMDYQLFVASGMREAYMHGSQARLAVMQGLKAGRSVVIAAAIIMISVFGGFVFAESAMIRPIGFGLAFGVLMDAFLVRLVLIPALMHLFGDAAWWLPKWLEKILPNVDVEGAALERHHGTEAGTDVAEDSRGRSVATGAWAADVKR